MQFHYVVDFLPFILATLILVVGPMKVSGDPLKVLVLFTVAVFMLAQSAWFSSVMQGNSVGLVISNYIWFVFNTLVMTVLGWTVFRR